MVVTRGILFVFRNGNDAFEYLSKSKVDLVILDVYMPVLDGLTLLKKIRTTGINTDVIMVTASNDYYKLSKTCERW